MTAYDFIEILFAIFGILMLYINLVLAKVTITMALEPKGMDSMDVVVATFVHVCAAALLCLGIWGVGHF